MKWFRRNIRTSSRLALFALALQFVLSFGHFHVDAAQAAPTNQTITDIALAQEPTAGERQRSTDHDHSRPSNEPCAICAVMSAANKILSAAPSALPLPDAVRLGALPDALRLICLGTPWPAFQSRAPPVS